MRIRLYQAKYMAKLLNMSEKNVKLLTNKGVIPEKRPGLYDLMDATKAYIDFLRKDTPENADLDYNTERAKLIRAKRQQKELEVEQERGNLHKTEDIEVELSNVLIRFKARISAIPAKLSPIVAKKTDEKEIFGIIKRETDEALEELSDFDNVCEKGRIDGKTDN